MNTAEEELTTEELLICLIEECGEVIQASTKCLRFGFTRYEPDFGKNDEVLAQEIGDLLAIVDALPKNEISESYKSNAKATKIAKIKRWKKYAKEHPL